MLTFGSLFSGIGGLECGFEKHFKCLWQVEIDKQCRSILKRHFPGTKMGENVKDVTTNEFVRPDIICGGFPCQDLSVAGRRAGLAGERSGLWWQFHRIIDEFRPNWVCIENVPGLLSSNKGRDMGTILWALGELGYGWAYRVLDAQWFGVPQRRRRVFIVGCLGNWRNPAEVLFERESLPWDPPPCREKGQRVADTITRSIAKGCGNNDGRKGRPQNLVIAGCLNSGGNSGGFRTEPGEHLVAHTLSSEGADASEDGTGRGTPIIPIQEVGGRQSKNQNGIGLGIDCDRDVMYTLQSGQQHGVAFAENQRHELRESNTSPQLSCGGGKPGSGFSAVRTGMTVRRLTPRECERLQGFSYDWTRYADDGTEISDSARYRMIGNAVAVPVAQWLAMRIERCL